MYTDTDKLVQLFYKHLTFIPIRNATDQGFGSTVDDRNTMVNIIYCTDNIDEAILKVKGRIIIGC